MSSCQKEDWLCKHEIKFTSQRMARLILALKVHYNFNIITADYLKFIKQYIV